MIERDKSLERHLTQIAARAAGLPIVAADNLHDFADLRARPGGLVPRSDQEWDQEAAEEFADGRNYLVWPMVMDYPGYLDGEPEATARFERRMRALRRTVETWWEHRTDAH